jgi:putative addiction module antidote
LWEGKHLLDGAHYERYTFCATSEPPALKETPHSNKLEGYLLQIKKIGNSVGLILPKELLARLKLKAGDQLHVVEQTERGIKLSPYDPKHAKAMDIARRSFRKYADTYKALAK